MSSNFKSLLIIRNLLDAINTYTATSYANLTEAIKALIIKCDKEAKMFRKLCEGTISEVTAHDFGMITKLIPYLFQNNSNLSYVEIPATITEIGKNCFYNCKNVVISDIPDGITVLEANTFYMCENVDISKLPISLTEIGTNVFSGCKNLKISEIPAGVVSIDRSAFLGCTSLSSITFKGTPASLDRTTFQNCTNITEINVPWEEGAIANAPWGATNAKVNYNCK